MLPPLPKQRVFGAASLASEASSSTPSLPRTRVRSVPFTSTVLARISSLSGSSVSTVSPHSMRTLLAARSTTSPSAPTFQEPVVLSEPEAVGSEPTVTERLLPACRLALSSTRIEAEARARVVA